MIESSPPLAYASPGRRLLAAVIDNFVVSFIALPFSGDVRGDLFEGETIAAGDVARILVSFLAAMVLYSTAMHTSTASTLGKMAARIRVVNDDGSKASLAAAFVRAVALAAIVFFSTFAGAFTLGLPVFLILNFAWPIWNPRRQTWHDMIARTVVVLIEPRRDPQAPEGA